MQLLNHIENNESKKGEKGENRRKAAGLRKNLNTFESAFMTVLWTRILEQFDKTNLHLQAVGTNLKGVVDSYQSLINFVTELRTDEMFEEFINEAKKLTEGDEVYEDERVRKLVRTLRCDESKGDEVFLRGRQKLKVCLLCCIRYIEN